MSNMNETRRAFLGVLAAVVGCLAIPFRSCKRNRNAGAIQILDEPIPFERFAMPRKTWRHVMAPKLMPDGKTLYVTYGECHESELSSEIEGLRPGTWRIEQAISHYLRESGWCRWKIQDISYS